MFEVKHEEKPPEGRGQAWRTKYPFMSMEVGDHFDAYEKHLNVQFAASKAGSRNGMKFTTRKQEDGALRVWRTA